MRHYTEIVPPALTRKLKVAGMPMIKATSGEDKDGKPLYLYFAPTYADVFDWFLDKQIYLEMSAPSLVGYIAVLVDNYNYLNFDSIHGGSWHEAANAAIEKALEILNDREPEQ